MSIKMPNTGISFQKSDDELLAMNTEDFDRQLQSMSTEEIAKIRAKVECVKQEKREAILQSTAAQLKEIPKEQFEFLCRTCLRPEDTEYLNTIILASPESPRLTEMLEAVNNKQQNEYKKYLVTTAVSELSEGGLNFNSPMDWVSPSLWNDHLESTGDK